MLKFLLSETVNQLTRSRRLQLALKEQSKELARLLWGWYGLGHMIRKTIVGSLQVLLILVLGGVFFFFPVGRKTPYGHLCAILDSEPAQEALEDAVATGQKLKNTVIQEVKPSQ